jgi:hypothetical protein
VDLAQAPHLDLELLRLAVLELLRPLEPLDVSLYLLLPKFAAEKANAGDCSIVDFNASQNILRGSPYSKSLPESTITP